MIFINIARLFGCEERMNGGCEERMNGDCDRGLFNHIHDKTKAREICDTRIKWKL